MRTASTANLTELATAEVAPQRATAPTNQAISGADYLAFVHDPAFWPNVHQAEVYAQDVVIEVDGKRYEQEDIERSIFTLHSTVTIIAGEVFEFETRLHTLQAHYEAWSMARNGGQG